MLARVDGPLDETVPAARPVTIEDLLTFRMGFGTLTEPTYDPPFPIVEAAQAARLVLGAPDPRTPHDPDEWIRRLAALPLMYQPGERWLYNAGSLVLGVLLARAADRPLGDLLRERLFDPLGMTETGFWLPAERAAQLPLLLRERSRDRRDDQPDGDHPARGVEQPAGLPVGSKRSGVHRGRVSHLRPNAVASRGARRHPAAVGAVRGPDDHQPADTGADGPPADRFWRTTAGAWACQ
nr:hypothetical protein GCM10020092_014910 [Actinoplanes digitatis]